MFAENIENFFHPNFLITVNCVEGDAQPSVMKSHSMYI